MKISIPNIMRLYGLCADLYTTYSAFAKQATPPKTSASLGSFRYTPPHLLLSSYTIVLLRNEIYYYILDEQSPSKHLTYTCNGSCAPFPESCWKWFESQPKLGLDYQTILSWKGPIVRPLGWRSSGEFYPVEFLILGISRPRAKYGTT